MRCLASNSSPNLNLGHGSHYNGDVGVGFECSWNRCERDDTAFAVCLYKMRWDEMDEMRCRVGGAVDNRPSGSEVWQLRGEFEMSHSFTQATQWAPQKLQLHHQS